MCRARQQGRVRSRNRHVCFYLDNQPQNNFVARLVYLLMCLATACPNLAYGSVKAHYREPGKTCYHTCEATQRCQDSHAASEDLHSYALTAEVGCFKQISNALSLKAVSCFVVFVESLFCLALSWGIGHPATHPSAFEFLSVLRSKAFASCITHLFPLDSPP